MAKGFSSSCKFLLEDVGTIQHHRSTNSLKLFWKVGLRGVFRHEMIFRAQTLMNPLAVCRGLVALELVHWKIPGLCEHHQPRGICKKPGSGMSEHFVEGCADVLATGQTELSWAIRSCLCWTAIKETFKYLSKWYLHYGGFIYCTSYIPGIYIYTSLYIIILWEWYGSGIGKILIGVVWGM